MRRTRVDAKVTGAGWYEIDNEAIGSIRSFCEANAEKNIFVTFERIKSKRTREANDYYWGVVIKAFQREWPDIPKDEIHRILGEQFRKFRRSHGEIEVLREIAEKNKRSLSEEDKWYVKGSSEMNSYDFWLYCEQCTVGLMEIGGYLETREQTNYKKVKEMFGKDA